MKSEFVKPVQRYRVAPLCPCGRSNRDGKFAPFLINDQPQERHGHCFSCGNTYHPNSDDPDFSTWAIEAYVVKPKPEPKNIAPSDVVATLRGYHLNNFAKWLKSLLPDKADELLSYFDIGTCRKGGTLFWYRDRDGNYRKLKRMFYKADGHRYKPEEDEYKGRCSPLHYKNEDGYEYCLYGEFQLPLYTENTPVFLVESEKTVVLSHALFPQYIWLATGGVNMLKLEQAKVLAERKVVIIPDMHQKGRLGAQKTKQLLDSLHCDVSVCDLNPLLETGEDIADLLFA